jgi:hypothetical protein
MNPDRVLCAGIFHVAADENAAGEVPVGGFSIDFDFGWGGQGAHAEVFGFGGAAICGKCKEQDGGEHIGAADTHRGASVPIGHVSLKEYQDAAISLAVSGEVCTEYLD